MLGAEGGVDRSRCRAAVQKRRQQLERGGENLVRSGIYLWRKETLKATYTEGNDLSVENPFEQILAEQFRKRTLQYLADCL